jgi:hypothetical protein
VPEAIIERTFDSMKFTSIHMMVLVSGLGGALMGQNYVNSQLPWHDAILDGNGKLLAWHNPDKNQGYDKVMRLGWDSWNTKLVTTHATVVA